MVSGMYLEISHVERICLGPRQFPLCASPGHSGPTLSGWANVRIVSERDP